VTQSADSIKQCKTPACLRPAIQLVLFISTQLVRATDHSAANDDPPLRYMDVVYSAFDVTKDDRYSGRLR